MISLNSDDLPRHLAGRLHGLYLVQGNAPLLMIEAVDAIRAAARAQGYTEREVLTVEPHFRWETLSHSLHSRSLFDPRKLLELRLPTGKPGIEGAALLQNLPLHEDVLLLLTLPQLDWTAQKSKWYQALQQHGVLVKADDVSRQALPDWISARLRRQQQSADRETLTFLSERCEGNLLAAFQEIQKLALLYPPGELDFEAVRHVVMDVARYDVYKLADAVLQGDLPRFAHILTGLREEGTASVLVLWALSEDLQMLGRVSQMMQAGSALEAALRTLRVRDHRKSLVAQALRRLNFSRIQAGLQQALQVDRTIKGLRRGDEWDEIMQLGWGMMRT